MFRAAGDTGRAQRQSSWASLLDTADRRWKAWRRAGFSPDRGLGEQCPGHIAARKEPSQPGLQTQPWAFAEQPPSLLSSFTAFYRVSSRLLTRFPGLQQSRRDCCS